MLRLAALLAFTTVLAACGSSVEESADRASVRALAAPAASVKPSGRLQAADGRSSFAIVDGDLRRFSAQMGKMTRTYPLSGTWQLTGISATGAWVALQRAKTEVLVLETKRGTIAHRLRLRGNFRVEAVSAAGDFLFLQQNFVDGSYAVRGYDLAAGQLLPGSLGRKGETVRMQGDARRPEAFVARSVRRSAASASVQSSAPHCLHGGSGMQIARRSIRFSACTNAVFVVVST